MEKIKRNEDSRANLETIQNRLLFLMGFILFMILVIIYTVSFLWLPYWIFYGKNIYQDTLNKL